MKIIFFVAQTLNAKIAHSSSELVDWTSPEDKKFFHDETRKCRVIVMGNSTYKTIGRALPGRLNVVMTRTPDPGRNMPDVLEFTDRTPREIVADLERRGFDQIAVTGGAQIFAQFLEAGLCDELAVTIEPKIFGTGIDLFADMQRDFALELVETRNLNPQVVLLRYKVAKY